MGGWIALHVALKRPERVAAIVGMAAAPDFTDWGFTPEQRQSLLTTSRFERANADGGPPLVTHARFVESGAALRMLHSPIAIDCPVRLIHGDKDEEVPVGVAFKLLEFDPFRRRPAALDQTWRSPAVDSRTKSRRCFAPIAVLAEKLS